jgi:hypothetical protein
MDRFRLSVTCRRLIAQASATSASRAQLPERGELILSLLARIQGVERPTEPVGSGRAKDYFPRSARA